MCIRDSSCVSALPMSTVVNISSGSCTSSPSVSTCLLYTSDKLCIIGETGSGKSILLLAVLRLLPASAVVSGDVCFHGQSLFALSPKQMDGVRGGQDVYKRQVSLIAQERADLNLRYANIVQNPGT